MSYRTTRIALLTLPLTFVACGGGLDAESDADEAADYDRSRLDEYRGALPDEEQVEAKTPGPEADPNALTLLGDAELAHLAIKSARDVNAPAKMVVFLLRQITNVPPTLYDSEKREFVWGPWDNEDAYGQVLVYIRENPAGDDFKYGYALVRLVDSDIATAKPVIWGGATPGEEPRQGMGVTLWDFEADNAFSKEHDPNFDAEAPHDEGRFAMVYGRGDDANGTFKFNVAVVRDFISKDDEDAREPANLDYFYGHVKGNDGVVVDFLDWQLTGELCNADPETCFETPGGAATETLQLRAAFVDRGMGRAEAQITGGDLSQTVSVVECWDDDIDRTHMSVSTDEVVAGEIGTCVAPFDATLAALGVPTIDDLDDEMLEDMDCAATNGLEGCDFE
jgi:hypothetical protein